MTADHQDSDQEKSIRRKLAFWAASLIGMPAVCAARCRRAGQCEFTHKKEGGPFCAHLMTAEEKDLCGRAAALGHHYRTAASHQSFEAGIRQALSGGDIAPLLAAAALSRCFRPGNEVDIKVARLRREMHAAEAAACAARRTARRKTRRARKAALSSSGACPAARGEETSPEPPPLPLLSADPQDLIEERMRDTVDPAPGTAPFTTAENPPDTALRIRPLDRPPLVP